MSANDDALLLPLLRSIFPAISQYETLDTIVQANAEGRRIRIQPGNKEIFVKRVVASAYSNKQWPDLRRTLLYARNEVRFYNESLPLLESKLALSLAPKCYSAACNLQGWIDDEDRAVVDAALSGPFGNGDMNRGGYLVLDCLSDEKYMQDSPLTLAQASKCLATVAQLHAAAWQDKDLLTTTQRRLSLGSYHLTVRNPKVLETMIQSWENFKSEFRHLAPDLFAQSSIAQLGKRIHDMAHYISDQVSPGPNDPFATIVHGDFKAMNLFLPKDEHHTAVMIDFASTGIGFGMSDVAMHIVHAVQQPFDWKGENELIHSYLDALDSARAQYSSGLSTPYPRDVAMRHYRLAYVDYFRFILGRFWKSASIQSFEKNKSNKNVTLVNRDVTAAFAFISRVDVYLAEIEMEKDENPLQ